MKLNPIPRLREKRREMHEKMVPNPDNYQSSEIDAPGPSMVIASVIGSFGATAALFVIFTPWFFSRRDSLKAAVADGYHLYMPHLMLLALLGVMPRVLLPLALLLPVLRMYQWPIRFAEQYLDWGLIDYAQANSNQSFMEADPSDRVDDDRYWLPVSERHERSESADREVSLEKSMSSLAVGESRSGKTSAIKMLAAQLSYGSDTGVVAHGSVGEYSDYFARELGLDVIRIGESGDRQWNLFREIPPNSDKHEAERKIRQISETMITDGDTNSPYFPRAARDIFVGLCMVLWESKDNPHHGDLHGLIRTDPEEVAGMLEDHGYDDAAGKAVDDGETSDEWATMTSQLKKMFVADFAREGDFSFREYISNPAGRVVVVESPEAVRGTGSMFAALLDESIASMISTPERQTIAILDEVDTIAPMRLVGDLAARGAAQNSPMIVGVQTISQLRAVYGRDDANGLIGNCQQLVGLSPGTDDCIEVLQGAIGQRREKVTSRNKSLGMDSSGMPSPSRGVSESEELRDPITAQEMNNWRPGEGVVVGRSGWWYVRLADPDDWIAKLWESRGSASVAPAAGRRDGSRSRSRSRDDLDDRAPTADDSGTWGDLETVQETTAGDVSDSEGWAEASGGDDLDGPGRR